jgi:hypothetical protein
MTKEEEIDMAIKKLSMLKNAIEQANEEDGESLMDTLKASAFEVILLNPGIEESEWANILVSQYGSEVVDVYGNDNPQDVFASIEDLWKTPYLDDNSGLEKTYEEWAGALANEMSVQMYYDMIEKLNKE